MCPLCLARRYKAQRYVNIAVGVAVKYTLYAHDVPLLFISVFGLIVFMAWICQLVLTTLSLYICSPTRYTKFFND